MNDFRMWECLVCGFIYDEAKGWPDDGIAPGTRWEDVPDDWLCPECGVGKSDFEMVDIGPSPSKDTHQGVVNDDSHSADADKDFAITEVSTANTNAQQWQCYECDFVYQESAGWKEDGIAAGTRWNELPYDWDCPDCGAEQSAFSALAEKRPEPVRLKDERIVVIGSGLAAYNFVRELRKLDPAANITMLTRDDGHFYSKPQISTGYTKKQRADEMVTAPAEKMASDLNIAIRPYTEVTEINTSSQTLMANGQSMPYDKLILAWGASCISPPMQGTGMAEVYQVNDLLDYSRFRTALVNKKKVLVIGAGLIGSEYANDLANGGFEVEAVDPLTGPLATLLPPEASQAVQRGLESLGVKYHFGTVVDNIDQAGRGVTATLANGESIDADIVLSAVGVRPRLEIATQAGIETNRGIVVNRRMETSAKNVYALGDCAEVNGHVLYYLLPLMACARALAKTLAGSDTAVSYGAMPVKVKTPVCPLTVLPPAASVDGEWVVEQDGNNTRALFYDADKNLRGFALTGEKVAEANVLAKVIPALME